VAGFALHALPSSKHLLPALGENSEYGGDIGSDRGSKVPNPLILKVWLGGLDSIEEQIRNPTKDGKN
jgi:hypothetical protein